MGGTVAVDIGTSGIRAQALSGDGRPLRTCITSRNPIPGANVMDHMSFAIDYGEGLAHSLLIDAVHSLCNELKVPSPDRIAVCGNPIQLSLFEGIGIKDLAYAGENKLRSEKVEPIERRGHVADGERFGFPGQEVVIPPAVRHEIGADALAMMLKSGFLEDDMCMVTDFGTNAEMALKVGDNIYTGSAAAGPAMEGQQISCGMLAGPGAVSDLIRTPSGWQSRILDDMLEERNGPVINLRSGISTPGEASPEGITGTGVVALVHACMQDGLFEDGKLHGGSIRINRKLSFTEKDLREAGKAMGAIRAGHMTLMLEAGVDPEKIGTMYMAGASGTYVDPFKAKGTGMIIPDCTKVKQVGNTSLALQRDLASDPGMLDELNSLKDRLTAKHIMFASSDTFSDLYLYEFGYWNDGMPIRRYERALERYGMEGYLDRRADMTVEKVCRNDIGDVGESFRIIPAGTAMKASWECSRCSKCVDGCPERALSMEDGTFSVDTGLCLGTACQKCRENCPSHVFDYSALRPRDLLKVYIAHANPTRRDYLLYGQRRMKT